ncbi:hypothetical protein JCM25156A_32650 [Komagataeibacter kakiaceti JCM 25156]|uniref:invasion associated locus B family protein n=1 Tax=Komagataeibacter kakiaceti TaxID=943261 RepID=UPI0005541613|nr:invasion associated locus B family protein [Komagataeibacter kakiaceti]
MNRKLAALSVAGLLCVAGGSAYFYNSAYATVSSPKAVEHKDEVAPSLATSSEHILPGGASSLIADDRTIGSGLTFSTCVPAGCLVPLNLDQRQLGDLESAKKVEVKFSAVSGQDINIPLSNKGLDKAVRRLNTVER